MIGTTSGRRLRWGAIALALAAVALAVGTGLYRTGALRFNHPSRTRFPVRGIDVSHHQGEIDWRAVREAGVDFTFIKATEGMDHEDRRFGQNWKGAGNAGIARGAYHFFTFCSPGAAQAGHFVAAIDSLIPELPPVADVEFSGNCESWSSVEDIRRELAAFLAQLERSVGRPPLLYVTPDSYRRIVEGRFGNSEVWIRDIFFEPSRTRYGAWAFWQYADNGRLSGITGPVDLDVFCYSRERFRALSAIP